MGSKSRVKGIVVQIGGDTVGLDKALQNTNKQIGNTQSKLKDVERLLKLDPTNTTLLEQKQKLLFQATKETAEKLQALNDANDDLKDKTKNYDAWKQAYDPIKAQIDDTSDKLKKLKAEQKEMEDCGEVDTDAYKELTEEIQQTSQELRDLKKDAKAVSDEFGNPVSPDAYDALQREIAETEQQLKQLQDKTKEFGGVVLQVMQEAGDKVSEFGGKVKNAGEKISDAGEKLLPATAGVIAAGTMAVDAGSDLLESQNKVSVAFGDSAERIEAFSDTTLDAYGIAKGTALDMAALFGDMATSMGLPQDEAAAMSETLVGLAGDLASFKNSGLENVQSALKGIFTGETESLKALGVVMNQNMLLEYAMEQGMIDLSKSAEQQEEDALNLAKAQVEVEKANYAVAQAIKEHGKQSMWYREALVEQEEAERNLAAAEKAMTAELEPSLDALSQAELVQLRYAFVLDATANAQGDFANTSDGAANSMRVASEATKEMASDFGILLAPYVAQAAKAISEVLKFISDLPDGIKWIIIQVAALVALLGPALIVGGKVISGLGMLLTALGQLPTLLIGAKAGLSGLSGVLSGGFVGAVGKAGSALAGLAANPVTLVIAAVVGLVALMVTKGEEMIEFLNVIDSFLQESFAYDWTQIFGPVLGGALNDFFDLVEGIWNGIKSILEGVINFVQGVFTGNWEQAWKGVRQIFTGIFEGLEAILKAPINGVIRMINRAIDGINWLIDGVNKIPGVNIGTIGQIPFLANGGEVIRGNAIVGDAGPELLTVLQDRTVVQPLTNNYHSTTRNLGGVSVAVYGAPGQSVRELAEAVAEEMQQIFDEEEAAIR